MGGVLQEALLSCVSLSLIYHGIMVVMIENLGADRSQAMTCILTWNSTCRRCEKTGLVLILLKYSCKMWSICLLLKFFPSFKAKTIVYWCWAEHTSRRFVTEHNSTRLFLLSFPKSLEVPRLEMSVWFCGMLYVWKCTLRSVLQTIQREYKLVQYSLFSSNPVPYIHCIFILKHIFRNKLPLCILFNLDFAVFI